MSIANHIQTLFPLNKGTLPYPAKPSNTSPTANPNTIDVLVCGAHLQGLPLNWQLTERGATLKSKTQTAAHYRMFALAGGTAFRPGLILDKAKGAAIAVEVWAMPIQEFGSFVAGIPAPLGIGKVELENGESVSGFICEEYGVEGAQEVTHLGGWRGYLAEQL